MTSESQKFVLKRTGAPPMRFRGICFGHFRLEGDEEPSISLYQSKTNRIILEIICTVNDETRSFVPSFATIDAAVRFIEAPTTSKLANLFDEPRKQSNRRHSRSSKYADYKRSEETAPALDLIRRVKAKQDLEMWARRFTVTAPLLIDTLLCKDPEIAA